MKFVLQINLGCNLIPVKALGQAVNLVVVCVVPFEHPVLLVSRVLKRSVPVSSLSHVNLVCSELLVARSMSDGLGLRLSHLKAAGLSAVLGSVTVLLHGLVRSHCDPMKRRQSFSLSV